MAEEAYEILSLAMRYAFIVLGALIVLRSYRWLLKDHRAHKKEMKRLPDAGLVGEIVSLDTGKAFPLPREGTIGSGHMCDIAVRGDGVRRLHATFRFKDGKGVHIVPHKTAAVMLDGKPVLSSAYALHGSLIELGSLTLRVRLFAGLNVPRLAVYDKEPADADALAPDDTFAPEPDEFLPQDAPGPLDAQATWGYAPYPPQLLRDMAAAYREPPEQEQSGDAPNDQFSDPRYDGNTYDGEFPGSAYGGEPEDELYGEDSLGETDAENPDAGQFPVNGYDGGEPPVQPGDARKPGPFARRRR